MENLKTISTVGSITKVEMLNALKSNILENTFVLESAEPFPGYHDTYLPSKLTPHHIFLLTKIAHSYEEISRASVKIRKNCSLSFGARPAELFIFNTKFNAIRIKGLKSFELIQELQKWFMAEGIFFRKTRKFNNEGLINVKKHFELIELAEGIYKDAENPSMYYLKIPNNLAWKVFEKMTIFIRNNLDNSNFDAAMGVIHLKDHMDVVRIFEKESDLEFLKKLRGMYLEEIRKLSL